MGLQVLILKLTPFTPILKEIKAETTLVQDLPPTDRPIAATTQSTTTPINPMWAMTTLC